MRGETIANLFFEASTRTRVSFEFAEKRTSADAVNVAIGNSSVSKAETLVDTARFATWQPSPTDRAVSRGLNSARVFGLGTCV